MARPALPPAKLLAVVAPVSIVGVGAYIAATLMFVTRAHSATEITGVLAFLLASTFAERYPVPVEGADANGVSLGFVFAVAALVLFGWAPATFVYASAPDAGRARSIAALSIRTIYNCGVFGLTGAIAGIALSHIQQPRARPGWASGGRDGRDPLHGEHAARDRGDRAVRIEARLHCA